MESIIDSGEGCDNTKFHLLSACWPQRWFQFFSTDCKILQNFKSEHLPVTALTQKQGTIPVESEDSDSFDGISSIPIRDVTYYPGERISFGIEGNDDSRRWGESQTLKLRSGPGEMELLKKETSVERKKRNMYSVFELRIALGWKILK